MGIQTMSLVKLQTEKGYQQSSTYKYVKKKNFETGEEVQVA